jgi:Mg2+ and Co2+ transporter CorA
MNIKWRLLASGSLQEQPSLDGWQQLLSAGGQESWFDIIQAGSEELRSFLEQLGLHPLQIARCVDASNDPGVITFGETLLMEYPTAFDAGSGEPGYLSIIIKPSVLITVRHGSLPALDELEKELAAPAAPLLRHLPQILYLILDQFADLNVNAQINIREQILHLSKKLADHHASVNASDLSGLRWEVDKLVSLIENQLYCVSGLRASDAKVLQESHRKTFIQDLISEAEVAQRGVYRLENRLNNLYNEYQMAGSDLVEKRLRFLTIVSAITLPLGLIAGLLGMNVGGLPGTAYPFGFVVVILLMPVALYLGIWAVSQITEALDGQVRELTVLKVENHLQQQLFRKAAQLDLAFFETPTFYDQFTLARNQSYRVQNVYYQFTAIAQNIITAIALFTLLGRISLWIPAILLLATLPRLVGVMYFTRRKADLYMKNVPEQRLTGYLSWLMGTRGDQGDPLVSNP